MNRIRQWWYAFMVCRKYKLKLFPAFSRNYGEYNFESKWIVVSFFSKDFISIFLHEIGHHVHDKCVDYPKYLYVQRTPHFTHNERDVFNVMESESKASRFARKTGKVNTKYLLKAFNTYSSCYLSINPELCNWGVYEKTVDKVYGCIRSIEK